MNNFIIVLAGVAVMLSGIGQVLLKRGALSKRSCFAEYLKPYLNRYTLSGYCLLSIVTVISIYVLQEMPLKLFFPIFISGNLIVVVILSYFILHEIMTYRKIVGIGIIVLGILVFGL